ncbi:tetratricopeptide repeat protein [Biformimicrobium ophioploci]|uniref:Tetratricopeptide repeat protein n=1 Tax=Biformimicrobium ophioploci TaxID=3036711 RepID=A0ABQ6LWA2_9GAMM|nr:tetratricopeptide repeat protein [Microbulbifer sp. NKW57]GMG86394.1 hypothetical protein MNKW57_07150 [Microbulbifer sp. NKW57]
MSQSSLRVLPVIRLTVVLVSLVLGACAGNPPGGRTAIDPASVRVSGGVSRDFERSLEYLRGERYEEAIGILEPLVQRESRLPAPYVNLGIAYYRVGDEKSAEEAFVKALAVRAGHAAASNELGALYRRQGRFEEARTIYQSGLQVNPDYPVLVRNLGILCDLYLQDLSCALAQFQHYRNLKPDAPEIKIWLAELERRM